MASLLTIPQVAERLAVSVRTVERMIDDKELQAVRVRRSRRILEEHIDEWIEKQLSQGYANDRAGAAEETPCPTSAKIHRIGISRTATQAERELRSLVEPKTTGKPRR